MSTNRFPVLRVGVLLTVFELAWGVGTGGPLRTRTCDALPVALSAGDCC